MKEHMRVCRCGKVLESTRTNSPLCIICQRGEKATLADRPLLESMYVDVDGPSLPNKNGKREWTFTHATCGTRQTWVMGNVKARLTKNPDRVPCTGCKKH